MEVVESVVYVAWQPWRAPWKVGAGDTFRGSAQPAPVAFGFSMLRRKKGGPCAGTNRLSGLTLCIPGTCLRDGEQGEGTGMEISKTPR